MTNERFDRLPPKLQLAFALGTAAKIFGRERVQQTYANLKPLLDDLFGHGRAVRRAPGDTDDPQQNYWRGVWQIHDTDRAAG